MNRPKATQVRNVFGDIDTEAILQNCGLSVIEFDSPLRRQIRHVGDLFESHESQTARNSSFTADMANDEYDVCIPRASYRFSALRLSR